MTRDEAERRRWDFFNSLLKDTGAPEPRRQGDETPLDRINLIEKVPQILETDLRVGMIVVVFDLSLGLLSTQV